MMFITFNPSALLTHHTTLNTSQRCRSCVTDTRPLQGPWPGCSMPCTATRRYSTSLSHFHYSELWPIHGSCPLYRIACQNFFSNSISAGLHVSLFLLHFPRLFSSFISLFSPGPGHLREVNTEPRARCC
jgi:hypothetical protein